MTIKQKHALWLFVLWPIVSVPLGVLTINSKSFLLVLLFFLWPIIAAYRVTKLRCPHCQKPIGFQITPFLPENCAHCKKPLSGKSGQPEAG